MSVCIYNLKIVSLDSFCVCFSTGLSLWEAWSVLISNSDDAKWHQIVDLIQKENLLLSLCLCSVPKSQHNQNVLFIYFSGLLIRMNASPVFLGLRVQINTKFGLETVPGQQSHSSCGASHVRYMRSLMHNVCEFQRNMCVSSCVSLRFPQWPETVCGSCK